MRGGGSGEALAVPVCISVADPGGNLVAFRRMDGAPLLSVRIAQDKANTVTAFNGLPTHSWYGLLENEPREIAEAAVPGLGVSTPG